MSGLLPAYMGFFTGAGGPISPGLTASFLESRTAVGSPPGVSQHSFTGVNFGSPVADRLLVMGVASVSFGNLEVASASIGGVSTTPIVSAADSPGGNESHASLHRALVPTGTSGTVTINWSAEDGDGAFMVLYYLSGYDSATPHDAGTSLGITIPSGGIGIAIQSSRSAASDTSRGTGQSSLGPNSWAADAGDVFNTAQVDNNANATGAASWGSS